MADTAYFQYFGEVTKFGTGALMQLVSLNLQQNSQHIHINISSTGGCNLSALTVYNFLRNVPCKVTTHNIGYCDSAANIIFLAGKERIASPFSRFLVHASKTKFPNDTRISAFELIETLRGLEHDERMFANIFQEAGGIDTNTISQWMLTGKVFTPLEAQSAGIITSIANFVPALGAEIVFIPTEPLK